MNTTGKENKKITLLGFCHGAIPVVTEIANELFGCNFFDIVKNIEVKTPDRAYQRADLNFSIHKDSQYDFHPNENNYFFGVLDSHIKYILYHYFKRFHEIQKSRYINMIHPSSYFAGSSEKENGFLLEPLCVVSSFCKIGFGVTVKRSSSVGHHAVLEDFATINPGVKISGNVQIGEGATIGTGATLINNITIGKHTLIGAGSVVTKNIPAGVIAYGNPCRVIRKNERWAKASERLSSMLDNKKPE